MDTTTTYRTIIQAVLRSYSEMDDSNGSIGNQTLFDVISDRYAVMSLDPCRHHSGQSLDPMERDGGCHRRAA